jgi:hypothetical protein
MAAVEKKIEALYTSVLCGDRIGRKKSEYPAKMSSGIDRRPGRKDCIKSSGGRSGILKVPKAH